MARSSFLDALADPSKYDQTLIRRLENALVLNQQPASTKSVVNRKQTTNQTDLSEEKRRLAMEAANAASKSLGVVAQSGWTASTPNVGHGYSLESISCIASAFKLAISLLRKLMPRVLDVDRVVSSFVGKLIVIQLYEVALELLAGIKLNIIQLYHELSRKPSTRKTLGTKISKSPQITRFLDLHQYPLPAPTDGVLLGVIGTSLAQALTALAAVVSQSLPSDTLLDAFVTSIEDNNGILSWYSFLPKESADAMLARANRTLATTFSSSNAPPVLLLRLRTWALKCLLCRTTLDPDAFWSQATNYLVSHGRSMTETGDSSKAVYDAVKLFDDLVIMAQGRQDADTFVSGSSFIKFCEVVLVFAQRNDDVSCVSRIVQFMKNDTEGTIPSSKRELAVQLNATFRQGAAMLESSLRSNCDDDVVKILTQCADALSKSADIYSDSNSHSITLRSLDKLRRLCGKVLEEGNIGTELRHVTRLVLEALIKSIELAGSKLTVRIDITTCAVDSLSVLARIITNPETAYAYLERGVALINAHEMQLRGRNGDSDETKAVAKAFRSISAAFWNHAITLYQSESYATAVRFLLPCCELGAKACEMGKMGMNDGNTGLDAASDPSVVIKNHLPKRWELLGDCYLKIGDRKLAYGALIESVKTCSFDQLSVSAASLSLSQITSDPTHSHLASLVKRITHIAVFDLLFTHKASLCVPCTSIPGPEVVGLLLEWQVAGLEEDLWKAESRPVVAILLRDALRMYCDKYPIRRTRVLLQQLEVAYRIDDLCCSATDIVAEITSLLSKPPDTGKDAALSHFRPQYQAAAHMWMALHAHRHPESHTNAAASVLQQATLAGKILHEILPATSNSRSPGSPKCSPKAAIMQAPKIATRSSPRKRVANMKVNPMTPRPSKKVTKTPPKVVRHGPPAKSASINGHASMIDPYVARTIDMLARLLGLLGHVPSRIQFLSILQRTLGRNTDSSADEFILVTVDAAAEYLKLGQARRALAIYEHALIAVNEATPAKISDDVRVLLLLHYAEALAIGGDVKKSIQLYEEAHAIAQIIEYPPSKSTLGRIRTRIRTLEQSALASKVFSLIQTAEDDSHRHFALSSLKRALRIWHRAFASLGRLLPNQNRVEPNPFDLSALAAALPQPEVGDFQKEVTQQNKTQLPNTIAASLHWRIAEGLLYTLFDLARAYFQEGSVRGAEYFIDQARDLAQSLNSATMVSRALAKKSELRLHQGCIHEAATTLTEAVELLNQLPGVDAADVARIRAHHSQLLNKNSEAETLYLEALSIVSEMEKNLTTVDDAFRCREQSPAQALRGSAVADSLAPDLLATVLKQHIWLQRNEPRNKIRLLLERLSSLPPSHHTKAEELAIVAKLALHDAYVQFRGDLFLSSLTESTIAIPMGLANHDVTRLSTKAKQMFETLSVAETKFWANLECVSSRGQALHEREAAVSLALIRSFQNSLGKGRESDARIAVGLLDAAAAIGLRREYIDVIDQKFPEMAVDDLIWPNFSGKPQMTRCGRGPDSVMANVDLHSNMDLMSYWNAVRDRYHPDYGPGRFASASQVDLLPTNWTVVNISIAEDKSTMFFSRQRPCNEPLLFCVPLERHGRKDEDAAMQFKFDDAMQKLGKILQDSDQSAKDAKDVPLEDRVAKAAWWARRVALDKQMRELLDNIEFCWLGAFKMILEEPVRIPGDILESLCARFNKVFHRALALDKKRAARMKLDHSLMECFASLSPKCRDEELEDLVYFILDLYQYHGLHVALSEIDIDQVTVELRTALEEHAAKARGRIEPVQDAHLFLVLDKNVQGIPWESIPILRGKSVSRIPSLSFLVDRIEFAKLQRRLMGLSTIEESTPDRAVVNPKKTYYVLNPSGDLIKSQGRFGEWVKDMADSAVGWQGIVGRVPSEQELLDALGSKDLVIYIGHGGAEQYVRSNKIKQLRRCAATMLWGCSSGLMRDMGDFDRIGTPYNYMLAGCPTLIACLWDVTDNELDKFSCSLFEKLRLDAEHVKSWSDKSTENREALSVVRAVGQSRDACKLKYLTGSAPVVYGIPFYL